MPPAPIPAPVQRQQVLTRISQQVRPNGHYLGPWGPSDLIAGHDIAACQRCGRKLFVSPRGDVMGEWAKEPCQTGNIIHKPITRPGVHMKSELEAIYEGLLLCEALAKARQVREPVWEQLHGQKVKVYRNLHNGLFSVQHKGIVVAHVPEVHLNDASFVVNEAGRQKVLREKKKNVHAFVVGTVDHNPERGVQQLPVDVTYNPYSHPPNERGYFVRRHDKSPITNSKSVTLRLLDGTDKDGKPIKRASMTALEHPPAPAESHRHGMPAE